MRTLGPIREYKLPDEAATAALAADLAPLAVAGDILALWGDLGLGKTSFARAFVAARAKMPVTVPSPTFTLLQTYDLPGGAVWHYDLYRLAAPDDVWELGFEEGLVSAINLIEWPQRLGDLLPADRLDVELAPGDTPTARRIALKGGPSWQRRLAAASAGGAHV
jgi:tRNA threonylcarbamoyladenosine biosynthesis protein TsaE